MPRKKQAPKQAPVEQLRDRTPVEPQLGRVPSSDEVEWRIEKMSKLGAADPLAAEIAVTDVDTYAIERMLKAGCSLELAWRIRKPFEWELTAAEVAA